MAINSSREPPIFVGACIQPHGKATSGLARS